MSFLNPGFLIGLPLVAVPIVIHLLSRRQQKRIAWGAMRFLREAVTRRRRLLRLTDVLLMILRTLAFAFLIFALSRPLLPAAWLGGTVPREVTVVLDQSMSMSRRVGDLTLFERQIEAAGRMFDEAQRGDSVRVLLAGESPEWLTPDPVPCTPAALRRLREQLGELKPTLGAGDLIGAVREAADVEPSKEASGRVIVVMTDRQRFGWRLDERPLWQVVRSRLANAPVPTAVRLHFIDEDAAATGNLCVNQIESPREAGAVNQPLTFTAQVQNHSAEGSAGTLLEWRVDDVPTGVVTVPPLAPGAVTSLSLNHNFPAAGFFEVSCHLDAKDQLSADNRGHFIVQIVDRLPILVVEEAVARESIESDAAFLFAALGAGAGADAGGWRSVFQPTLIEPSGLPAADLSRFYAVVLADVRRLPAEALGRLEAYARAGGGVWITLGARTEPAWFNEAVFRAGLGLAPVELDEPVGDPENQDSFFSVRASSATHPATGLLSDSERLDLDRARIHRRHRFGPAGGPGVSVLLEVQPGDAVVIEQKRERGRVLVQTIPLGVSWSTLPLCQAYVAMVHEWLWYLAEPGLPRRNLAAGEAIVERTSATGVPGHLTLPDGRVVDLDSAEFAAGPEFRFSRTRLPGRHALRATPADASPVAASFFVQRNAGESDLRRWSETDLATLREGAGIKVGSGLGGIEADRSIEIPKHPLERWLLVALPMLLLMELLLAGWTTHRRTQRVAPVTMNG